MYAHFNTFLQNIKMIFIPMKIKKINFLTYVSACIYIYLKDVGCNANLIYT